MKLIVGLGNPGREYENTRHNAGWLVLDELARRWGWRIEKSRFSALVAEGRAGSNEEPVTLLKPLTYMNRSGDAVGQAVRWHKMESPDGLLIVLDDVDLPAGRLRMRAAGGSAGHRGLENIVSVLGRSDVARLRIGVGRPEHPGHRAADYVLSAPAKEEAEAFAAAIREAADAAELWLNVGTELAMNKVNAEGRE